MSPPPGRSCGRGGSACWKNIGIGSIRSPWESLDAPAGQGELKAAGLYRESPPWQCAELCRCFRQRRAVAPLAFEVARYPCRAAGAAAGSTGSLPLRSSKCTCGTPALPVEPAVAIAWPCRTRSPSLHQHACRNGHRPSPSRPDGGSAPGCRTRPARCRHRPPRRRRRPGPPRPWWRRC